MQFFFPMIAQLPGVLTGVVSVVVATAISFVIILLVTSVYRFHQIVKMAEETDGDEMGVAATDVLRVHLARYVVGSARQGTSFSLAAIRVNNPAVEIGINVPLLETIKEAVRSDDVPCVFSEDAVALIMEIEVEDTVPIIERVLGRITAAHPEITADTWRVGIATFPGHGNSGSRLISVAGEALEEAGAERPIFMPEIVEEVDDEDEENDEGAVDERAEDAVGEEDTTDESVDAVDEAADSDISEDDEEDGQASILDHFARKIGSFMQRMKREPTEDDGETDDLDAAADENEGFHDEGHSLQEVPEEESPGFVEEHVAVDNDEDEDEHEDDDEEGDEKSWAERRKTSMLDELTGVLRPSAVSSYMQRMMNEIRTKKKKSALFCIGVNNMDHISRVHGEAAVDDVLAGVSKVLQNHVRSTDLIGRHEKHAFLILAEISLEDAEIIGKRISTVVQQSAFESGKKKIKTTISLGVAAYPEHGRNLHLLYKAGQKVLDYNRQNDIRAYAVYDPAIHDSVPSKPMKSIKSFR